MTVRISVVTIALNIGGHLGTPPPAIRVYLTNVWFYVTGPDWRVVPLADARRTNTRKELLVFKELVCDELQINVIPSEPNMLGDTNEMSLHISPIKLRLTILRKPSGHRVCSTKLIVPLIKYPLSRDDVHTYTKLSDGLAHFAQRAMFLAQVESSEDDEAQGHVKLMTVSCSSCGQSIPLEHLDTHVCKSKSKSKTPSTAEGDGRVVEDESFKDVDVLDLDVTFSFHVWVSIIQVNFKDDLAGEKVLTNVLNIEDIDVIYIPNTKQDEDIFTSSLDVTLRAVHLIAVHATSKQHKDYLQLVEASPTEASRPSVSVNCIFRSAAEDMDGTNPDVTSSLANEVTATLGTMSMVYDRNEWIRLQYFFVESDLEKAERAKRRTCDVEDVTQLPTTASEHESAVPTVVTVRATEAVIVVPPVMNSPEDGNGAETDDADDLSLEVLRIVAADVTYCNRMLGEVGEWDETASPRDDQGDHFVVIGLAVVEALSTPNDTEWYCILSPAPMKIRINSDTDILVDRLLLRMRQLDYFTLLSLYEKRLAWDTTEHEEEIRINWELKKLLIAAEGGAADSMSAGAPDERVPPVRRNDVSADAHKAPSHVRFKIKEGRVVFVAYPRRTHVARALSSLELSSRQRQPRPASSEEGARSDDAEAEDAEDAEAENTENAEDAEEEDEAEVLEGTLASYYSEECGPVRDRTPGQVDEGEGDGRASAAPDDHDVVLTLVDVLIHTETTAVSSCTDIIAQDIDLFDEHGRALVTMPTSLESSDKPALLWRMQSSLAEDVPPCPVILVTGRRVELAHGMTRSLGNYFYDPVACRTHYPDDLWMHVDLVGVELLYPSAVAGEFASVYVFPSARATQSTFHGDTLWTLQSLDTPPSHTEDQVNLVPAVLPDQEQGVATAERQRAAPPGVSEARGRQQTGNSVPPPPEVHENDDLHSSVEQSSDWSLGAGGVPVAIAEDAGNAAQTAAPEVEIGATDVDGHLASSDRNANADDDRSANADDDRSANADDDQRPDDAEDADDDDDDDDEADGLRGNSVEVEEATCSLGATDPPSATQQSTEGGGAGSIADWAGGDEGRRTTSERSPPPEGTRADGMSSGSDDGVGVGFPAPRSEARTDTKKDKKNKKNKKKDTRDKKENVTLKEENRLLAEKMMRAEQESSRLLAEKEEAITKLQKMEEALAVALEALGRAERDRRTMRDELAKVKKKSRRG